MFEIAQQKHLKTLVSPKTQNLTQPKSQDKTTEAEMKVAWPELLPFRFACRLDLLFVGCFHDLTTGKAREFLYSKKPWEDEGLGRDV